MCGQGRCIKGQSINLKLFQSIAWKPRCIGESGSTTGVKKYLTTVDELEKLTGYDFLSDVPAGVQAVIEAKKDSELIEEYMSDRGDELGKVLQNLTDHLLWISEIDSPVKVFQWESQSAKLTDQQLLERTHHSMDTAIETVSFDDFFATVTQDQNWFGTEEKAVAVKDRLLVELLKQHLSDLKVYRVGEVRIDLYIVGKMQTGKVIGLTTQAVET